MDYVVVIPALEPDESLLAYIDHLAERRLGPIIVINDGSGRRWNPIFDAIGERTECIVLRHDVNKGKGRAIKTAIQYYQQHFTDCGGIITVDCDGQHAVEDVVKVRDAMARCPNSFIMGCRSFSGDNVPARSLMGNRVTSAFMRFLYGIDLEDTQTGLRGMPNSMLSALSTLRGERYDYEVNVLLYVKRYHIAMEVVPIQTVYINNNAGSHYRSIVDSLRIALQLSRGLLWFGGSGLISGLVDYGLFVILTKLIFSGLSLGSRVFVAAVLARVISSLVNYSINRKTVFGYGKRKLRTSLVRYYALWVCILIASFSLTYLFSYVTGIDEVLFKIIVDILLSIISYQVQLRWVFK